MLIKQYLRDVTALFGPECATTVMKQKDYEELREYITDLIAFADEILEYEPNWEITTP